jgi:dienelactone hydrolase
MSDDHPMRTLRLAAVALVVVLSCLCRSGAAAQEFETVQLPSSRRSGIGANDVIWAHFLAQDDEAEHPAVIVLHALGTRKLDFEKYLARTFHKDGMVVLLMEMPYHMHRKAPGLKPKGVYLASDVIRAVRAIRQGADDVGVCVNWLSRRPDVDEDRIGVVGISLGAIVGDLAFNDDPRIRCAVSLVGGGDVAYIAQRSAATLWTGLRSAVRGSITRYLAEFAGIDPARNPPADARDRVYMVNSLRDAVIPQHSALALWEAYGEPPISWTRGGHFSLMLAKHRVSEAAGAFLESQFSGEGSGFKPPKIGVPLIRVGVVVREGLQSPCLSIEVAGLGQRPHIYGALMLTTDTPDLWAGVELCNCLSLGVAWRKAQGPPKPGAFFHLTF